MWRTFVRYDYPDSPMSVSNSSPRARELLLGYLDDAQREMYEQHGCFLVEGSDGHVYGLFDGGWAVRDFARGRNRNVYPVSGDTYDPYDLPDEDRLLGQLLVLTALDPSWFFIQGCYSVVAPTDPPFDRGRAPRPWGKQRFGNERRRRWRRRLYFGPLSWGEW